MRRGHETIGEAFLTGASGFVLKTYEPSELVKAIHSIAKGSTYITPQFAEDLISMLITTDPKRPSRDTPLTSRQREVLQLLSEGKTMKEAAALSGISSRTAESHKYEIIGDRFSVATRLIEQPCRASRCDGVTPPEHPGLSAMNHFCCRAWDLGQR